MSFHVPEKYRVTTGRMSSDKSFGNNGQFIIRDIKLGVVMTTQASDGLGWEHVSCSMPHKIPTWKQMCYIKSLFWDDDDCVIQYHPPKADYVNNHINCLHLWRPVDQEIIRPPSILVGINIDEKFSSSSKQGGLNGIGNA